VRKISSISFYLDCATYSRVQSVWTETIKMEIFCA